MTHTLPAVPEAAGRWIKVVSWHEIAETYRGDGTDYNLWLIKTRCGIERMWEGTSAEAPPWYERKCKRCAAPYWWALDEAMAAIRKAVS